MKLIKTVSPDQTETEVEIRYAKIDANVVELIKYIEQHDYCIYGVDNGRQYKIQIHDIYYIESVDKKTFIYTEANVFRTELRLYQLLDKLKDFDFIQASKFCIINMNVIEGIQTLFNSRLEAILINGEKVNVSRTYLTSIKSAFMQKDGE